MTNITSWVKSAGAAVLLVAIIVIILGKFQGVSGIGAAANTTLGSGITLIDSLMDYIEIAVLIIIGVWFFKSISSKGGMGA